MARITCYDGVECIGGNKILLEDGGTRLWLDFGLDFGRMGMYYEEFLKPKSCLGLYEPIQMGLIPPVRDLYRPDLVCPLEDPWLGLDSRALGGVDGILLSHAHVDHLGSLCYVRGDIPVYSSAMTLAIAKASQDSGTGGITSQFCYTTSFEASESGELDSIHHTRDPSRARPYVFVGEQPSAELLKFWNSTPASLTARGRRHEAGDIPTLSTCGRLNVRRFPVDHSVYGASAWAIETSAGWVVYTGDVRCHGRHADLTLKFAEEAAKLNPVALVIEGTRIDSETTCTEDQVCDRALDQVRMSTGLVVADFGPRNVERLDSFLRVAKETGRKLILTLKDAYLLRAMAMADADGSIPSMDDDSILIYDKYEGSGHHWKNDLRDTYGDKLVRPRDVARMQGEAICCFSFFDVNELAYIRPDPGSVWIYSSCEPFNEEMQIDFERLLAWVDRYEMAFPAGLDPDDKSPFHVSGHACRADLLQIVDIIRPRTVIPVHTEKPRIYAEHLARRCRVLLPERGMGIAL